MVCPSIFLQQAHRRELEREILALSDLGLTLHEVYASDIHLHVRNGHACVWGNILELDGTKKMWNLVRTARRRRGYKYWNLDVWSDNV